MDDKKARELMDKEITRLKEVAVTSTNSCVIAEYIAISDKAVQDKFFAKIAEGYVFKGLTCLTGGISVPEYRSVEFHFDCANGTFCLIPPSFLVVVDFVNKRVVSIRDPYLSDDGFAPRNRDARYGDGHMGWPQTAGVVGANLGLNAGWDGWAPFQVSPRGMDSHGLQSPMGRNQWDGWVPFQANQSYRLEPVVRAIYEGPNRVRLSIQLNPPNGCYFQGSIIRGIPGGSHLPVDQAGFIVQVFHSNQQICPLPIVPMHWDIEIPTEGKAGAVIYVTDNNAPCSVTNVSFPRTESLQLEKEFARS